MKYKSILSICVSFLLLTTSCHGIFNGIYDEPEKDENIQLGFNGKPEDTRYTLMLDARSYNEWIYIDLHNKTLETKPMPDTLTQVQNWDGKSQWTYYEVQGSAYQELRRIKTVSQQDAEKWDLAIHHFDVKTNGGGVVETPYGSIDELPQSSEAFASATFTPDQWTTHQCIVDFSGMLSYNIWYMSSMANPVLSRWVTMDMTIPPPVYSASKKVYLLRMKDGSCAALLLKDYMSDSGTKGFLTIDVKYPY